VPPPLHVFPEVGNAYLSHVKNMTLLEPAEPKFGDSFAEDGVFLESLNKREEG